MNFKTRRNMLLKKRMISKYPILNSSMNDDNFKVSYFIPYGIDTKTTDCAFFVRDAMRACKVFGKNLHFGSGDYFIKSRFRPCYNRRTK
jgi:hypothetical protein